LVEDDLVCLCRRIYASDYATEEELIRRLKQKDGRCYQCTLLYDLENENEHKRDTNIGPAN
jgi:hypothetical protein